jgi:ABC-2 type transport system ATP-binding protein
MSTDYAIEIHNIHKSFKLPNERAGRLKTALINRFKGIKGYREQKVLRGIDFKVKRGEFFGIVGRNGSGKSTLLKIISEIYQPTKGHITVNGKLVSFIELGVGFNPELTGRDNVYLNGALLGFSNSEIDAMYDDIVNFAELHDFMEQKLKNYSSGMQVRLAFSVAIQAKSDILVLDEVLAVGDEAFQRKCNDYFDKIRKDEGKTVVLVTHSMAAVRKYCDKAIMIRGGQVVAMGNPEDIANEYSLENLEDNSSSVGGELAQVDNAIKDYSIELLSAKQLDQSNETADIKIRYQVTRNISTNTLIFLSDVDRNVNVANARSATTSHKKGDIVEEIVTFNLSQLNDTLISVGSEIWDDDDRIIYYCPHGECPKFIISRKQAGDTPTVGTLLHERGKWKK